MRRSLVWLASKSPNPAPNLHALAGALGSSTNGGGSRPPSAASSRASTPGKSGAASSSRLQSAAADSAAAIKSATPEPNGRSPTRGGGSPTLAAAPTTPSAPSPPPRKRNRILMLCTALGEKDTPEWPFWKWQHMKATRGVSDFAMLAVTREDSFIGTIKDGVASTRALRRNMKTVDKRLLSAFLEEHYDGPDTWFVYGGHGVSDLLEFDSDHRMQVHELAECFGERKFNGILFDACLMASLDTAYYLRNNTRYVGASEGYMWEEDTWSENHMFNPYSAALMARDSNPKRVLQLIGEEYTRKSAMADFTVIDTKYAAALWLRVQTRHLADMNAQVELRPEIKSGEQPLVLDDDTEEVGAVKVATVVGIDKKETHHPASFPPARTDAGFIVPRDYVYRYNYQFPHSIFPDEQPDDHIVDLGCNIAHDPVSKGLLEKVVAWRQNPSNATVYNPPMLHGLNFSFSQYSYQAARKAVSADEAVAIGEQFELAAKEKESSSSSSESESEVQPLRMKARASKKSRHATAPAKKQEEAAASAATYHAVAAAAAPAPAANAVRPSMAASPAVHAHRASASSASGPAASPKAASLRPRPV